MSVSEATRDEKKAMKDWYKRNFSFPFPSPVEGEINRGTVYTSEWGETWTDWYIFDGCDIERVILSLGKAGYPVFGATYPESILFPMDFKVIRDRVFVKQEGQRNE
ncbi:hypothetical protein [Fictibacillus sp. NRS-1165]|uniref:hypothetical protein n=1 Tax=Fictibacillus sp. NRS-1165 TaxID=3144463 RepID=UPI003D1C8274